MKTNNASMSLTASAIGPSHSHLRFSRPQLLWTRQLKVAAIALLLLLMMLDHTLAGHVTGLTASHRHGQVFLVWNNFSEPNSFYKVYRSTSPITSGLQLTTCEYLGLTNQYSSKDHDLTAHYGTDHYLRIDSASTPLLASQGLFVATSLVNGNYFYAVTVLLNGAEDTVLHAGESTLLSPISEQVSKPKPVFQQEISVNGTPVEHWVNFMSFKQSPSEPPILTAGFMASDFLLYRNHNTGNQPLCLRLHGGGDDLFANILNVTSNEMNLTLEQLFPGGASAGYWGANSNFNIYEETNDIPATGTNNNFFQQLYNSIIDWAIDHLAIDSNRIYLIGTSAGACGAFSLAMTYPDKIAAVSLGVPCFNVGFQNDSSSLNSMNHGGEGRDKADRLLGMVSTNLPTNLGINTFDQVNGGWMVHATAEKDRPFIYSINGKNDVMVGWTEKTAFYDSVNANHTGGYYFWDSRDHGGSGSYWNGSNFKLFRFRRNASYPAFANCSLNENYGNGSSTDGDTHGSVNGMLDWTDDIIDTDSLWKVSFFIRDLSGKNNQKTAYPDSATSDITPRRIQNFFVPAGATINWEVLHNNLVVQSGSLLYAGGIITLHGIKAYKDTAQLKLTYSFPDIFYIDVDQDGFGNPDAYVSTGSCPDGYVTNKSDCNDENDSVHPEASDVCNQIDDNCDGQVDEHSVTATLTPAGAITTCSGSPITLSANSGSDLSYQWLKNSNVIAGASGQTIAVTGGGKYQVKVSNMFGCTNASPVTKVYTVSTPAAAISYSGEPDLCTNESIVLNANTGDALTYQWKRNEVNINGAVSQTYTATATGTFKVVVTNQNGCSKKSSGVNVTQSCKVVPRNADVSNPALSVYPNPASGPFIIRLNIYEAADRAVSIQLINAIGQTVLAERAQLSNGMLEKELLIDQSLAEGLYLVRVVTADRVYTGQVVLRK
jgi:predicted esterase